MGIFFIFSGWKRGKYNSDMFRAYFLNASIIGE